MDISLPKKIQEQMVSHQFVVSIMGNLNQEFLKSIIKITDSRLTKYDLDSTMKNKIFHFMVECTQNLCKVQEDIQYSNNSLFLVGKSGDDYSVVLGSVFNNNDATSIIELIEKVNGFDSLGIKEKFYEEISSNESSKKNQMLLSLLSISMRTKEKVQYDSFAIDGMHMFLSFKVIISKAN